MKFCSLYFIMKRLERFSRKNIYTCWGSDFKNYDTKFETLDLLTTCDLFNTYIEEKYQIFVLYSFKNVCIWVIVMLSRRDINRYIFRKMFIYITSILFIRFTCLALIWLVFQATSCMEQWQTGVAKPPFYFKIFRYGGIFLYFCLKFWLLRITLINK